MPIPVAMAPPGENRVAAKKLPSVLLRAGEDRRVRSLQGASDLRVEITARITAVQRVEPRRTINEA